MSPDDRYKLPDPPKPELTQVPEHPRVQRRANLAICVAGVAVLIAGCAAWFAYLQWTAADRQANIAQSALNLARSSANEQKSDVERSRKAAEKSADAADKTVGMSKSMLDTSIQAMDSQNGAVFTQVSRTPADTKRGMVMKWKNVGRTQALNVQIRQWFTVGTGEFGHLKLIFRSQEVKISPGIIWPEGTLDTSYADSAGQKHPQGVIRQYGRIEYRTVYRNKHAMNWCYEFSAFIPEYVKLLVPLPVIDCPEAGSNGFE